MGNKLIYYLTYQDFPAQTANSQQTVSTCKYFVRNKYRVVLFFPLRSKNSSEDLNLLKKQYEFSDENFNVVGIAHKTKFEGSNIFKKVRYLISHILWSYQAVKKVIEEFENPLTFFTRSDWVFYFLSKRNMPVVYECHKLTKIRKKLIKLSIKKSFSKIIFMNEALKHDTNVAPKFSDKTLVQTAGYDEDFFYSSNKKISKQVIYSGSLERLGVSRNLDFILNSFADKRLSSFTLKVFGGTKQQIDQLSKKYDHLKNISLNEHISKKNLAQELANSEIGILASSNDDFSKFHTNPLKYYEYSASGLKIVATDFPAHRSLNQHKNILYYRDQDNESFINAIITSNKNNEEIQIGYLETMDSRVKNIINFIT